MLIPPGITNETSHLNEIFPDIVAISSIYGDQTGGYADFLRFQAPEYTKQPYYFWYQPRSTGVPSTDLPTSTVSSASGYTPSVGIFIFAMLIYHIIL